MGQTGIKVPKGSEVYDNLLFTLKVNKNVGLK
jgi:hypothetical protein